MISRRGSLLWLACATAASALLAGCATPRAMVPVARESYYTGRMAIFREPQAGDENHAGESWSAGFELKGSPDHGELMLYTPLGTTVARVRWSPDMASLTDSGGREHHYPTLDALTLAYFHATIPVAALFDWLAGHATRYADLGWHADLSRSTEGIVSAERREPSPVVRIRVVLEST